jgi:hypothetical protein
MPAHGHAVDISCFPLQFRKSSALNGQGIQPLLGRPSSNFVGLGASQHGYLLTDFGRSVSIRAWRLTRWTNIGRTGRDQSWRQWRVSEPIRLKRGLSESFSTLGSDILVMDGRCGISSDVVLIRELEYRDHGTG